MEFLGDRGAADDVAALEHADRLPAGGEIRGADEAVVAAADDDDVVARARARHGRGARYSSMPAATVEKPQSTNVTSPVIALASSDR